MTTGSIVHGTPATKRGSRPHGLTQKQVRIRATGIGGSEIGTVLGVNPYKSAIQLFHEKLGLYSEQTDSLPAFMGNYLEDKIAELWQYWEGSPQSVLSNYKAKRVIRTCRKPKETLHHPKYTWMIANLDREILGDRPGVLDCKMLSDYASKQWESGVPASYVFQMQQYMMCHEPYSELAILRNGNVLDVVPIEPDKELQERIIAGGTAFWNRIERAKALALDYLKEEAKATPNRDKLQDLSGLINSYAPPVDSSPAYEEYIRKKYTDPLGIIEGTAADYDLMVDYVNAKSIVKQATEEMQQAKNLLISVLSEKEEIRFQDGNKITFRPDKNGNRTLRVFYI